MARKRAQRRARNLALRRLAARIRARQRALARQRATTLSKQSKPKPRDTNHYIAEKYIAAIY